MVISDKKQPIIRLKIDETYNLFLLRLFFDARSGTIIDTFVRLARTKTIGSGEFDEICDNSG